MVYFIIPNNAKFTLESSLSGGMQKYLNICLNSYNTLKPNRVSILFHESGGVIKLIVWATFEERADQVPLIFIWGQNTYCGTP